MRHLHLCKKCAGYSEFMDELDPEVIKELEEAEDERVRQFRADGSFDCCALRSEPTIQGPLRLEYVHCFKGRPRPKSDEG